MKRSLKDKILYEFRYGRIGDIRYGVKNFIAIRSGYKCLTYKRLGLYFTPIETPIISPHYVCAEFNNGRHIPLPILLDSNRCRGLQKIVIDKGIKSGKLIPARRACLQYMKAYNPRDRENFYKI